MGHVIDLDAHRRDPHHAGPAVCLACGRAWMAVIPVGEDELQCPGCGLFTGVRQGLCRTDGEELYCDCGNSFFRVSREGIYCAVCGELAGVFGEIKP